MSLRFVLFAIGRLCIVLAVVLLVPAAIALAEIAPFQFKTCMNDPRLSGFILAIIGSLIFGLIFTRAGRNTQSGNSVREGFAIVTFGWLILTFFSCLPLFVYMLSNVVTLDPLVTSRCFTDAYFEIMSGYTTTGASILTDVEILPRGILFWRSMTHWLGGMGIVTLALAIFPAFGVAGYQMFRGELPGPTKERLKPRLAQTAKILWGVYALLTLVQTVLLCLGGMTIFEALCHAFGTMATGGFSTRNASIGAYHSAYIDWVVIIFMFLAGVNFMLHFRVLFYGKFSVFITDPEFRFYLGVVIVAIVISTAVLTLQGLGDHKSITASYRNNQPTEQQIEAKFHEEKDRISTVGKALRHSAFQVVSIITTTGFCTADFDMWPNAVRIMLVVLMFFGGCAGSTGGGIKSIRVLVVLKAAWRQVKITIQPRLVSPIKISGSVVEEKLAQNIIGFFVVFIMLSVMCTMIMSFMVPDFTTAVTSVAATICNIGPGLSGVGPMENYSWIPLGGKWVLIGCMLLGRLEVFTVLIAFAPLSWRK